jgi:hypothetical protein
MNVENKINTVLTTICQNIYVCFCTHHKLIAWTTEQANLLSIKSSITLHG